MSDFERRRKQNREAQRRFRQRRNQRKTRNQSVQRLMISEATTEQPSQPESPATSSSSSLDKLIDPFIVSATSTDSFLSTVINQGPGQGMGLDSPLFLDELNFTNIDHGSCIHDAAPTFSKSLSQLLQVSSADTPSDSNTDQLLGALSPNTHDIDRSPTAFSESAHNHSGGPSNENARSFGGRTSLGTVNGNGATSTSSGSERKPDNGGWQNPLHMAAAKGDDKITRILLQHNIDCNEKDGDGLTPLIHATIGGYEDVVRSLLLHGATISTDDSQHCRSPLHWAIVHRRESVLKILLDWCVTQQTAIDIYDKAGKTPLHTAVDTGYAIGVQLLLQLGANARYRTRKQEAPR
ncbi:ankyrin repeat-containing domain protein [Xylariaceae sp. FL1651]|nr:ankyrin repeat-containing domain protein [Xylariaceae sp. FL1651]